MSTATETPLTDEQSEMVADAYYLVAWRIEEKRRIGWSLDDSATVCATEALIRAAKKYDSVRGKKFDSFARRCIDNALADEVRRWFNRPHANIESDVAAPSVDTPPTIPPRVTAAIGYLTERDRMIIGCHFGLPGFGRHERAEMKEKVGCETGSQLTTAVNRAVTRLRSILDCCGDSLERNPDTMILVKITAPGEAMAAASA